MHNAYSLKKNAGLF